MVIFMQDIYSMYGNILLEITIIIQLLIPLLKLNIPRFMSKFYIHLKDINIFDSITKYIV